MKKLYFVEQGITEQCYYSLANLECILCNPEQSLTIQYQGERQYDLTLNNFFNHQWILRICPDFCDQIYSSCGDPTSTAILGATNTGDATTFCESINMQGFVADQNNVTGIFFGSSLLVSQFDCYEGASSAVVKGEVGKCLTPYTEAAANFQQYYYILTHQNTSPVLKVGFLLTLAFFLIIWI